MRPHVRVEALPRARTWGLSEAWIRTLTVVVAGALVAGLVFLYLWQGCTLSTLRAQRAQLTLELLELERELTLLSVRLQEATTPQAVAERARALGMCPFTSDRVIRLLVEDDQRAGP